MEIARLKIGVWNEPPCSMNSVLYGSVLVLVFSFGVGGPLSR